MVVKESKRLLGEKQTMAFAEYSTVAQAAQAVAALEVGGLRWGGGACVAVRAPHDSSKPPPESLPPHPAPPPTRALPPPPPPR